MEKENIYETKSGKVEILRGVVDDAEGIQALVSESSKGMYRLCGWTEKEIEIFKNSGAKIFSLGKLTLRAETAAIVALGVLELRS